MVQLRTGIWWNCMLTLNLIFFLLPMLSISVALLLAFSFAFHLMGPIYVGVKTNYSLLLNSKFERIYFKFVTMQFKREKKTWKKLIIGRENYPTHHIQAMPNTRYDGQTVRKHLPCLTEYFFWFYFKFTLLLSFLLQMDESEINVCPFITISLNSNEEIWKGKNHCHCVLQ